MNIDQLRSNGHSAQVERKSKRVDYPRLLALGRELLLAIGEDPEREGLRETPRRWANAWREFMEYDPGTVDTCFESVSTDQMFVVSGIREWSTCQHFLLPIGQISQSVILRQIGFSDFLSSLESHKSMPSITHTMRNELSRDLRGGLLPLPTPKFSVKRWILFHKPSASDLLVAFL